MLPRLLKKKKHCNVMSSRKQNHSCIIPILFTCVPWWCWLWETINTGPGTRGSEDPRTWASEDWEPKHQGTNDLVLLHLAFITEMQLVSVFYVSSNIQLYHCWSKSLHCYIHSRCSSHQIVLFQHYLLAFCIYSLLYKPKNSLLYWMQDYKRNCTEVQGSKVKWCACVYVCKPGLAKLTVHYLRIKEVRE